MAPDRVPREGPVAIGAGSRGIGAAIAETLAETLVERDATVIVSAHAADPPDALVARARHGGW